MVKYLALIVAVAATLVTVDAAQARGRRGCPGGNCNVGYSAGCPGGNCYVPVGSAKTVTVDQAAPAVVAAEGAAPAVTATAPAAAPRYTSNVRRGWFGRRRS